MFDAANAWRARGYGLVHYRFPGLDGRPIAPPLRIAEAAEEIVALAARFPKKPLRLLGFSTGGAIVLTASAMLGGDLRVALMASAVARGGGTRTFCRSARDLVAAAMRAGTLDRRRVWLAYYGVLLFGRKAVTDLALAMRAEHIIEARRDKIVYPDQGRPKAHMRDLRRWQLPRDLHFAPGAVRLFCGMEDPVFSHAQQMRLARTIGAGVTGYNGHGHLLFATHPPVFDDVFAHFEGLPPKPGAEARLL